MLPLKDTVVHLSPPYDGINMTIAHNIMEVDH